MTRNKSFNSEYLLYMIATPIGNLGEFSARAIETIKEMDLIACEDTRNTQKLLNFFNIKKPLVSLREHNEVSASESIIEKIKSGTKVAYVSDAGYPAISDPGNILVSLAIKNNISVSTISGSSAFLNALVSSGLPTNHFYFYGFLSPKENQAKDELNSLKNLQNTIIFYESPHRIENTIKLMHEVFGDREAVIARELTKLNEEFIRGNLSELTCLNFETIKGELVVLIKGQEKLIEVSEEDLIKRINELLLNGVDKKNTVEIVSKEYSQRKNYIKDLLLKSSNKLK